MNRDKIISEDSVFVIAEVGSNHNGLFEKAKELVQLAAWTGADAVKFQIYRSERKVLKSMLSFPSVRNLAKTQYERWKTLEFSDRQWTQLSELAHENGLYFIATVCDNVTVDQLDPIIDIHKVASGDATNPQLIEHVAATGKPVIMSTGMSSMAELEQAVTYVPQDQLVLLHCMAAYPTPVEHVNLATIPLLVERFGVPVGYSDHTIGKLACLAATAMGAAVVEKHFTFDKSIQYADHALSAEPNELKALIEDIRSVKRMWGIPRDGVYKVEDGFRSIRQRGLYAAKSMTRHQTLTNDMLIPLLPVGDALPASMLPEIIGRRTNDTIGVGDPVTYSLIDWEDGE